MKITKQQLKSLIREALHGVSKKYADPTKHMDPEAKDLTMPSPRITGQKLVDTIDATRLTLIRLESEVRGIGAVPRTTAIKAADKLGKAEALILEAQDSLQTALDGEV